MREVELSQLATFIVIFILLRPPHQHTTQLANTTGRKVILWDIELDKRIIFGHAWSNTVHGVVDEVAAGDVHVG